MIALALCLAVAAAAPDATRAIALVQEERHAEALAALADEPDPLRRAQTEVWIRHQAGDLEGALRAALEALGALGEDDWLLEQGAWIATSLHRGALGRRLAERRLARLEAAGTSPETLAAARELLAEAEAEERVEREAQAAVRRARVASVSLAGALVLAMLAAAGLGRSA